MKLKTSILFFSFFLLSFAGFSQTSRIFTADSLVSELKNYYAITENSIKKDTVLQKKAAVLSKLQSAWFSSFSNNERKVITKALNGQIKRKFKKNTDIWYFIETIVLLKKEAANNFALWIDYYNFLLNTQGVTTSQIKRFTNHIYFFVRDKYLINNKSSIWKYKKGTYRFVYDKSTHIFTVQVQNTTLEAYSTDGDTLRIYNTSGIYNPVKSAWKGEKGYADWSYFNYDASKIKANLSKYHIDLKKNEYFADSVLFINKQILDYDILGTLHDKASKRAKNKGFYPHFRSYEYNYEVKSKQKYISFKGGIEMKGAGLKYVGTDNMPAKANYVRDGKLLFTAKSDDFYFLDSTLRANRASVKLYINDKDSIMHPNVQINIKNDHLSFSRNHEGSGNRPFYNSYQKVFMKMDNISWNVKDTLISFYSQLGETGYIQSIDYFTKEDFTKYRMYELKNPLFGIKKYTRKIDSRDFFVQDYAKFVKINEAGVTHRLMQLWYDGFIDYSPKTKLVHVNQKLFDYIDFFFDKKDYDVIKIDTKGIRQAKASELFPLVNAVFNLNTGNLTVYGVERVVLNKRKKVGFVPANKTFVLGKNRDMYFAGRLRSGMTDFYGKDFYFNYEDYNITVSEGDSLVYRVWNHSFEDLKETDRPSFVNSTVEKISGLIRVDLKTNKSGAKNTAQFPSFSCKDTSYVYYDKKGSNGSAYPRESFYFKNYPFEHDSLLALTKYNLKIPGILISGGIFKNIEDTLIVQKDYSLGFIHATPDEGINLFEGKLSLSAQNSKMKSFIKLSNQGLEANGIAKWNNATIKAKEFNLYPDSLAALAENIQITEALNENSEAQFPHIEGETVATSWDAENNVITYKTTKNKPVDMFKGKSKFEGEFQYSPEKITGKGQFEIEEGILAADEFNFTDESVFAPNANIVIRENKSPNKDVIIKNMKSYVDIKAEKAVFEKNEETDKEKESSVNFVNDQYVSYPSHLLWHTGQGKLNFDYNMNLYTNKDISKESVLLDSAALIGTYKFSKALFTPEYGTLKFVSTNPDKDSLMFFGSRANYSTENKKIIVKDVQRIIVADIVVTPSSDVIIDKNGDMEKLLKTTIKARGLHMITEVDINISSSNKYVASSGIYQYEDVNKKTENINFDNITYDQQKEATVAHGFIEQYEKFTLNPWFDYYGDVYFNATKDRLRFEGYAKIIHSCNIMKPKWFYFKSDINPDSIYLPLEPMLHSDLETNKARVFADIMVGKDSTYMFPLFLSSDPYGSSESILSVRDSSYYVTYNKDDNKYQITTLDKFNNRFLPGNYLDLNRVYCIVNGEGYINYTKSVKINDLGGTGNMRFDTNSGELLLQTLTYLDFFFSQKALNVLKTTLIERTDLKAIDVQSNSYKKAVYELIGVEKANKFYQDISAGGGQPGKMPDELKKTLVFANLELKWDAASKSFKSKNKIGIMGVGGKMINKYVNGYIQIKKRRQGDRIYIYLETAEKEWFFFTFSGGIMRTISSIHEYNQIIEDLKTKRKRFKTDKGIYNYMQTNEEAKNLFIYGFTGKHPAIDDFDGDVDMLDEYESEEEE